MKLFLDTTKFTILSLIAVGFASIGIVVTSLLGLKRSVATD